MKSSSKWLWKSMAVGWICLNLLTGSQQQMKLSVVTYLDRYAYEEPVFCCCFPSIEHLQLCSLKGTVCYQSVNKQACQCIHCKFANKEYHQYLSSMNCVTPAFFVISWFMSPCLLWSAISPLDLPAEVQSSNYQLKSIKL